VAIKDFTTIAGRKACETVIRGSRFIGIAGHVETEESLRALLADVEKEFPAATHYCYAAIYGGSDRTERSSDNGEPSGTAGKPILSVIRGSGLTDTAVVVVRYFGGTLLGTGGLVSAYSESASAVIGLCEKVEKKVCDVFHVDIPYADYDRFMNKLSRFFATRPECEYGADIAIRVVVPVAISDEFVPAVTDVFAGRLTARLLCREYCS